MNIEQRLVSLSKRVATLLAGVAKVQGRVPAGSSRGGEFTSGNGGGTAPTAQMQAAGFTHRAEGLSGNLHVYTHPELGTVRLQTGATMLKGKSVEDSWSHHGVTAQGKEYGRQGQGITALQSYIGSGGHIKRAEGAKPKVYKDTLERNLGENRTWKKIADSKTETVSLYHVTPSRNAAGIQEKGLIAGSDSKTVSFLATKPTPRDVQQWSALATQAKTLSVVRADVPKSVFREMLSHKETNAATGELVFGGNLPQKYVVGVKPL